MRPAILVLFVALMLEGCSTSLAPTLPSHGSSAPASAPVAVAVSGPAASSTTSQPAATSVVQPNAIVPTAAPPAIDVGALAQIVARLPHDFYRFEIDLFICAGAIVAIGIVNAFLIASLLATRRRDASRPEASPERRADPLAAEALVAVAVPVVVPPVEIVDAAGEQLAEPEQAAVRACACGAAIGARSKSGRCRRCATASRAKRPQREVATARA